MLCVLCARFVDSNTLVTVRVARLEFLIPTSRKLAFVKVVWHEKTLFGMFLTFLSGVGCKKAMFGNFKNLLSFELELREYFQPIWHTP